MLLKQRIFATKISKGSIFQVNGLLLVVNLKLIALILKQVFPKMIIKRHQNFIEIHTSEKQTVC